MKSSRPGRYCFRLRLACESPGWQPRLGRHDRLGGGADGRWVGVVVGLGGLFGLFDLLEVDLVAERFELALESAGAMFGRVTLALPVGSELSERDLVADDVVVGDEEVVADRADRFGLTAPPA